VDAKPASLNLPGHGLTQAQWTQVQALTTLDREQLRWLSGFFAGVAYGRDAGVDPASTAQASALAAAEASAAATGRITVLYGSETGNSTGVAKDLARRLGERGHSVSLFDMADYKARQLADEQVLLIVTSTYGEGDPPQPATTFFEFIEGRRAPRLEGVRYAVLGLGDSTYEQFCAAGRRLDARLQELGAIALLPRVDCDVDYEDEAKNWIDALLQKLESASAPLVQASVRELVAAAPTVYDKRNPFPARIIENLVLTGRGSSKEVRHVELSLDGSGLRYEPGDALGLLPENDSAVVRVILDLTGLSEDAPITIKGESLTLGQALATRLDIVQVTPHFLEYWAGVSEAKELRQLHHADRAAERIAFARTHHIADVMRNFPVKGVDAQSLVGALRPLQPRLYSIASSASAVPEEVHITVATVSYELHGQPRRGVASGHLAARGRPDEELPVYVQESPHFRLPADDVPIVMIGAGTGIAPYRAFLQERELRGRRAGAWLFFGERNFRTDFLYQVEWQGWLKEGVLTRMDVAFSRDSMNGSGKTYVWHRLLERSRELYDWLEEGAHVYVCGDANGMAPDVDRTLAEVVMQQGGRNADGASEYLRALQESHRYHRDVY
jgi:sulfite reductase (NADPH) flavoprotein alpha-component